MTRLSQSVDRATAVLEGADLATDTAVRELLEITWSRRSVDLTDLSPAEQAVLIAERAQQLQPSTDALAERIASAQKRDRPFTAKLGIDPTGHEVHLGHAVPMQVLSRFQRMGHQVILIVGDVTAKIGDPSGRSDERPPLTDEDIARNLTTYGEQVSPFFDFEKAQLRRNGDWLRQVTLPRLIEIAAHIPVSMSLQREDFRKRLDAGHGLSLAELLYSVAMALDSVEINCDIELGGIDQFLNMQMCRKVMEICGQAPELVLATSLIEGTDGTGSKMSKSKGNYVPLTADAGEIFGKIMSVPDRLVGPYLRALSEWRDSEIAVTEKRVADGTLHPVELKKILAGEVAAAIRGVDAAMAARESFAAQFSRRSFGELDDLPRVGELDRPITEVVRELGFAKSNGDVRRVAQQNGLRLVVEAEDGQQQIQLGVDDIRETLASVLKQRLGEDVGECYLKVGRKLARIS
ncbi:MAG TPA: tyrosine--tRNA ligase [Pseudonocardia sp.]|jgi:tyrosyl-tRNA synthetase|nr:tyrosine--tRNA ligase [Pseudonocardia sp.]